MHIQKERIPARIDAPGAVARQQADFGDSGGCGVLGGEYFSLGAGADITPLLEGLPGDLCQAPHWGYLLEGDLVVTYADGTTEPVTSGDLFHWPPGHTVRVETDAEVVLFSPEAEHGRVLDHMKAKLTG